MTRSSFSLLAVVLLTACVQDDPASPLRPQMSAGDGAQVVHVTFPAPFDNNVYAACLGENLHFTGTLIAKGYMVFTPSGLSRQHMLGVDIQNPRIVGVTSGTVWTWSHFRLRNVLHTGDGPDDVLMMETDLFESESGQRMHALNHITLLFNAHGEPTGTRWDEVVDCKVLGSE